MKTYNIEPRANFLFKRSEFRWTAAYVGTGPTYCSSSSHCDDNVI